MGMKHVISWHNRLRHRLTLGAGSALFHLRLLPHRLRSGDVRQLRARPGLLASGTALALVAAMGLALPWWLAPLRWPALQQLHERTRVMELVDDQERWLGVLFASRQEGENPPYSTVEPQKVPDGFIRMLFALEDHHARGWRSLHGIDMPRLLMNTALAPLGLADGGASSLPMQLARSLHGMRPGGKTPLLLRKLIELGDGMVLHDRLGAPDGLAFRRWLAMHLPLATGMRAAPLGGDVRGIRLAARIFWNRTPRQLTLAQQAMLAAAVKHPLILLPAEAPASAHRLQQARWRKLKQRAARGLKLAFGKDNPAAQRAAAELAAMPHPMPAQETLARQLAPHEPALRLRIAANGHTRAFHILGSALSTIRREWRSAVAQGTNAARASRLRTTLNGLANARLRQDIQQQLLRLNAHPRVVQDLRQADVLVAVADAAGRIRLLHQSRDNLLDARYQPGSIAKMVGALALALQGDAPDGHYCRVPLRSREAGETSRAIPCRKTLTARQAFARSDSPAVFGALRRVPQQQLRRLAQGFDLHLHPGTPAATAIALGLAEITPRSVLRLTLQLTQQARTGHATQVRITTFARLRKAHKPSASGQNASMPLRLGNKARRYLASVLHAPLEPGGTLARLPHLAPHVRWLLGKTGTVDSPGGNTRAKWLTASFDTPGGPWVLVAMVSSRDATPLGRRLGDFIAPLAALAAQEARQTQN